MRGVEEGRWRGGEAGRWRRGSAAVQRRSGAGVQACRRGGGVATRLVGLELRGLDAPLRKVALHALGGAAAVAGHVHQDHVLRHAVLVEWLAAADDDLASPSRLE